MIKAAVTGNIGSGKSLICKIFESMKFFVFYADEEAKKLYDNSAIIEDIKKTFGSEIFQDGKLSHKKLAEVVFSDNVLLKQLEAIIHPAVVVEFNNWAKQHKDVPCVIMENAVFFEGGFDKHFDKTIVVTCPEEERIKRVMDRDGASREEVMKRMMSQWPEQKKIEKADYIIVNDGLAEIIPQIIEIGKSLQK